MVEHSKSKSTGGFYCPDVSSCRAGPFEREGKMQRRTDFAAGSEQESEREGASRKNNLAETNAAAGWVASS